MSSTDDIIKDFPRADKLNLTQKNPTVQDIKKGPIASLLTSVKRKYTEISISSKLSLDTNGTSKYNIIYGSLPRGKVITVWYCLDNWFSISYNGKTAYISGDYIEFI